MKVLPGPYGAKVDARTKTLSFFLRIERSDGFVVALTSSNESPVIGGEQYLADPGLSPGNFRASSGFNVGNTEIHFFKDDLYMNRNDVLIGRWAFAEYSLFRADPLDVAAGIEAFSYGSLGNLTVTETAIQAELRDHRQNYQQTIGEVTSPTCKTLLFSSRCGVPRIDHTFNGTVTAVVNARTIEDSSLGQTDDWFNDGEFIFTSGAAQGVRLKVRDYVSASGRLVFTMPSFILPTIGDEFTVYTGCQKRWTEDCVGKFNNGRRFQGEPHLPGRDFLTKPGDVSNG